MSKQREGRTVSPSAGQAPPGASRRTMLAGTIAATLAAPFGLPPAAQTAPAAAPATPPAAAPPTPPLPSGPGPFLDLYGRILAGRTAKDGKLTLDVPEIAENGNTVPIRVAFDSPMTAREHVSAIHLLATANPLAHIATFRFTPDGGRAAVSTRIRLAASQEIVALAETGDGDIHELRRTVKVTVGGCGG